MAAFSENAECVPPSISGSFVMYVEKEKLIELYKSMGTEALAARVQAGELTREAHELALAELDARGFSFDAPEEEPIRLARIDAEERRVRRRRMAIRVCGLIGLVGLFGGLAHVFLPRVGDREQVADDPAARVETKMLLGWIEVGPVDPASVSARMDGASDALPWRALYWRDGVVETLPVDALGAQGLPQPDSQATGADRPVLMFRERFAAGDGKSLLPAFPTGRMTGVAIDEVYRDQWRKDFVLDGRRFALQASALKDEQGDEIAGSLRLEIVSDTGARSVVLAGAAGHIFKELRVMWAGFLSGRQFPAFYLRRTLLTGEIDHVLSIAGVESQYRVAGLTIDPDRPNVEFSSGVAEAEQAAEEDTVAADGEKTEKAGMAQSPAESGAVASPEVEAPPRKYALSGIQEVNRLSIYASPEVTASAQDGGEPPISVPKVGIVGETKFSFNGASYNVVVEMQATLEAEDSTAPTYRSALPFGSYDGGGRSLVISLQQWNVRQVLLVTSPSMEGGIHLSAGDFDNSGTLSIEIDYYPHYNNGMTHGWRAVNDPGRVVKRISVHQSQGR